MDKDTRHRPFKSNGYKSCRYHILERVACDFYPFTQGTHLSSFNMADISGPGLLYVNSKLSHPEFLDEAGYVDWYDNDHIPEIMGGTGMHTAWRWKDINGEQVDKPYLTLYPMKDIAFLQTEEFKNISVHSPLLPKGMSVFDLAVFDVRFMSLVQVYDPTEKGTGR